MNESTKHINVASPMYAGAPYPDFDPLQINEKNFDSEFRCKYCDCYIDNGNGYVEWKSQDEPYHREDWENEIIRAFVCNGLKAGSTIFCRFGSRDTGYVEEFELDITPEDVSNAGLDESVYYSPSPYNPNQYKNLSYVHASPDKRYIKILKWFYDNGEYDKATCIGEVFKDNKIVADAQLSRNPRKALRGYAVTFFGQLVNDGLLDASKKGKFTIFSLTDKGENLLRHCNAI